MTADTSIHCDACGGRNPAAAEWCGQCFAPLVVAPPELEPVPVAVAERVTAAEASATVVADPADPVVADAPLVVDPAAVGRAIAAGGGRYRRTEAGIDWQCERCASWNSVDLLRCSVCQLPMDGVQADGVPAEIDRQQALLASWLAPGGGQWILGQRGRAVARFSICGLWLLGMLMFLVGADGSPQALLPVAVLLLGVVAIWLSSAIDTRTALAGGTRELLDSRAFLWIVVGVLAGVLMTMIVVALSLN